MRFVIYKNSILATICSMFGAAFIVMAVMALINGELEVLPGIGTIAAGIVLYWLGSVISKNKEKKKQAKAAKAAQADAAKSSGAGYVQTQNVVQETNGKPVKKSVVFAGILCLLAAGFVLWAAYMYSVLAYVVTGLATFVEAAMYLLLMIACFRTRSTQEVSFLHLLGFLGLTAVEANTAWILYNHYGMGGYTVGSGVHHMMVGSPLFKAAAFLLMGIFVLCAMRKAKKHTGIIVRIFWLVPVILLALAYAKDIGDNYLLESIQRMNAEGKLIRGLSRVRPELLDIVSMALRMLAVFFTGYAFQRISKKPAVSFQQESYVRAEQPLQQKPVQPQPQYKAPEQPKPVAQPEPAAEQESSEDVEKQLRAYRDLLECGILNQEEYEQKLRELKRG